MVAVAPRRCQILPNAFYVIPIQNRISTHNRYAQSLGLSYQRAVKRITMVQRQQSCRRCLPDAKRQVRRTLLFGMAAEVDHEPVNIQLPSVSLDRQLPSGGA